MHVHLDTSLIVTILLGIATVTIAFASFRVASRANRAQSEAVVVAVDAGAYERAKSIYEGAIETLTDQVGEFRSQIVTLQADMRLLRDQSAELQTEVARLRLSNDTLSRELAHFRN